MNVDTGTETNSQSENISPEHAFNAVLDRIPPNRRIITASFLRHADEDTSIGFLSSTPPGEVLPTLLSLLTGKDVSPQEKQSVLANLRQTLENGRHNGLTNRIAGTLDEFIATILKRGAPGKAGIPVSSEAQRYLAQIQANFSSSIQDDLHQTMAGMNLNILKGANGTMDNIHLVEATVSGLMNSKLDPRFREALFKTLLSLGTQPTAFAFFSDFASYNGTITNAILLPKLFSPSTGAPTPEAGPTPEETEINDLREKVRQLQYDLEQEKADKAYMQTQLAQREQTLRDRNQQILNMQAKIRELEARAQQTATGPGPEKAKRRPPRDPYDVFNLPKTATPEEIRDRFRALSKFFHPDAIRDFKDVPLDDAIKQEFNEFYSSFSVELNNAQAEFRRRGLWPK